MTNIQDLEEIASVIGKKICLWYGINDMLEQDGLDWSMRLGKSSGATLSRLLGNTSGRCSSGDLLLDTVIAIYTEFGLKPHGVELPTDWEMWVLACRCGDDELAMRLITDGFNPDRRAPGYLSAGNYAMKNRTQLPRTWSWFCKRELERTARKQKRFRRAGTCQQALPQRRAM